MLGKEREIKADDQWIFYGVTYTVKRNEEGELYFKHPNEKANEDDDIEIEHADLGEIIYKEG